MYGAQKAPLGFILKLIKINVSAGTPKYSHADKLANPANGTTTKNIVGSNVTARCYAKGASVSNQVTVTSRLHFLYYHYR